MAYQGTNMSQQEFFRKQEEIHVEVSPPERRPKPMTNYQSYTDYPIAPVLKRNCVYQQPTPVQKWGIPLLMRGDDVMAAAQTGSGKTAFFLYPSVNYLLTKPHPGKGWEGNIPAPRVIIMGPTRELCTQIYDEAVKFVKGTGLHLAVSGVYVSCAKT